MNLISSLKLYGLTEKEAVVYMANLELGSASAYRIGQKTSFPRSTCYEVLDSLQAKGLISGYLKKGKKHFNAEDPRLILAYNQNKLQNFENLLPQLLARYKTNKEQPVVRLFTGLEQTKLIFEQMLSEADKLEAIGSIGDLFEKLGEYVPTFVERRIKQKIPIRALMPDTSASRERQKIQQENLMIIRLLPPSYQHHGFMFIWRNKLALLSLQEDILALVIESGEVSHMQQTIFEYLWDSLE